MDLKELCRARNLTQEELAHRLGVRQTRAASEGSQLHVSRMEKRSDLHIGTLRGVIEAMGGELEITACFPDGEYRIDPLARVGTEGSSPWRSRSRSQSPAPAAGSAAGRTSRPSATARERAHTAASQRPMSSTQA
jgi:transcriptional regulator with XRE-family HTH domain